MTTLPRHRVGKTRLEVTTLGLGGLKSWLFPFGVDAFSPRFGSSRGTFMSGRAALSAAESLRRTALALTARLPSPVDARREGDRSRYRRNLFRSAFLCGGRRVVCEKS